MNIVQYLNMIRKPTDFEKTCLVACCSWTGTSGGHAERGPVGMPVLPGQHDSLALRAPSSEQTIQELTQLKRSRMLSEEIRHLAKQ